jgi:hypothetical protein
MPVHRALPAWSSRFTDYQPPLPLCSASISLPLPKDRLHALSLLSIRFAWSPFLYRCLSIVGSWAHLVNEFARILRQYTSHASRGRNRSIFSHECLSHQECGSPQLLNLLHSTQEVTQSSCASLYVQTRADVSVFRKLKQKGGLMRFTVLVRSCALALSLFHLAMVVSLFIPSLGPASEDRLVPESLWQMLFAQDTPAPAIIAGFLFLPLLVPPLASWGAASHCSWWACSSGCWAQRMTRSALFCGWGSPSPSSSLSSRRSLSLFS